jgi:NAD(P)H-dependent FMN reductase
MGIRAARFVERRLRERGHETTLVDAMHEQLPLLDRMYKEYPKGSAPAALERLAALYRSADAFVIVTGEYNHSLQPGLTNLLDHFLEEYFFRPSAIVSYSTGQFAGQRAAVHLQAMLCELGMPSISSTYPIARIGSALGEDGRELTPDAGKRFDRFASELEWYAEALRAHRERAGTPY